MNRTILRVCCVGLRSLVCTMVLCLGACGGGSDDDAGSGDDSGTGGDSGGPPPSYSIGGTVDGLTADGLTLTLLASEDDTFGQFTDHYVVVPANGRFDFPVRVPDKTWYKVIGADTDNERCEVTSNPQGQVSGADVVNVEIRCEPLYWVLASVSGLRGSGLTVRAVYNAYTVPIAADGTTGLIRLVDNTPFNTQVETQPTNPQQTCTITNANGTIAGADATVIVNCVDDEPEFPKRAWRMQVGLREPQPGFRVLDQSAGWPSWSDEGGGTHKAVTGGATSYDPSVLGDILGQPDGSADAEVHSGNSGRTYSVTAEAQHLPLNTTLGVGEEYTLSQYAQRQSYRKTSADARLQMKITELLLVAHEVDDRPFDTDDIYVALAELQAKVYAGTTSSAAAPVVDRHELMLTLFGRHQDWNWEQYLRASSSGRAQMLDLAQAGQVEFFERDSSEFFKRTTAVVQLAKPITLDLDLSSIAVDEEFTVEVWALAMAHDPSDSEGGYVAAHLRDPLNASGVEPGKATPAKASAMKTIRALVARGLAAQVNPDALGLALESTGLEATNRPFLGEEEMSEPAPPVCGSTGNAGTVQFDAAIYRSTEAAPFNVRPIFITRTGGSEGELEVTVETTPGTATMNGDYRPLSQRVRWGAGDTLPRLVQVELIDDGEVEGDETVGLRLSDPVCGETGATDTATLTIVSDERPETATFEVSGTVSGLTGSGLVLREGLDEIAVSTNGTFTFPGFLDGWEYAVQVKTQPQNPRQICTVTHGTGTIAGANVTNVSVTCVDAPASGSLDASFGSGGIASGSFPTGAGASEMAILGDGRIVLANSRWRVARYGRDGAPDIAFGIGGEATVVFTTHGADELHGIAVQPDGKIVVAGWSRPTFNDDDDFAVARLNADGSLDSTFGSGGKVTTDLFGDVDRAHFVLIQPDGRILVGGEARTSTANRDLALVRYLADGSLDPGFGSGGVALADLSEVDSAYAGALRADGRIIVGGGFGVSSTGDRHADSFLAQFLADGSLDTSFATNGILGIDLAAAGMPGPTTDWIEALALDASGRIVTADGNGFRSARFTADGALDTAYGNAGTARVEFAGHAAYARAIALQDDSGILVAGFLRDSTTFSTDFALARLDAGGVLDTEFASSGTLRVDFFGADDGAYAIAPQDGRMIVAGLALSGATRLAAMLRLTL